MSSRALFDALHAAKVRMGATVEDTEIDCRECAGTGLADGDAPCIYCDGTGMW